MDKHQKSTFKPQPKRETHVSTLMPHRRAAIQLNNVIQTSGRFVLASEVSTLATREIITNPVVEPYVDALEFLSIPLSNNSELYVFFSRKKHHIEIISNILFFFILLISLIFSSSPVRCSTDLPMCPEDDNIVYWITHRQNEAGVCSLCGYVKQLTKVFAFFFSLSFRFFIFPHLFLLSLS